MLRFIISFTVLFFSIPSTSFSKTTRPLQLNNIQILVAEPLFTTVNPNMLRSVDEYLFNQEVFPEIDRLMFFSNNKQTWFPISYEDIINNCFARRMLIDLFLWGETSLAGQIQSSVGKIKYLTPFLKTQDFLHYSWIETARIQVVGKLQTGAIRWSNHEAVVINSNHGIRVVDPSFARSTLSIESWFLNFAPIESGKTCAETTVQGLKKIHTEMVKESMGSPWNPKIPKCGYVFKQRLDALDMDVGTSNFWGTNLEKMLSRDLYNYMELRLAPH